MNEDDKKLFLNDFKKGDISIKLDMWFYAMDQEGLWEEIMDEMSKIARIAIMKEGGKPILDEE
jgi:hypothetical protein